MYQIACRPLLRLASVSCVLLLSACGDTTSEPTAGPEPGAARLAIVSGDAQVAPADSLLPAPLVVRVTDDRGHPVPGVYILWTLIEAGGFTKHAGLVAPTNANGQASLTRRLGSFAGTYATIARVNGDTGMAVRFTSLAHVQHAVRMRSADTEGFVVTDTVRATLAPFRVLLLDHADRPVPGVIVKWTSSGDGVSAQTSTTDVGGIAQITPALGPKAGNHFVMAHVFGLRESPVTFPIVATPGNPVASRAIGGMGQAGLVSKPVQAYAVQVTDAHGNAYGGIPVSWSVVSGGGSIDRATSVTGSSHSVVGEAGPAAVAVHTLGPDEDPQVVTATPAGLPGIPPVVFSTVPVTALVTLQTHYDYYCYYWGICGETFSPSQTAVAAGRSVLWVWSGGQTHDIVFEDEPTQPASAGRKTAGIHIRRFTRPGNVRYRCTLHSTSYTDGMVGIVTVN